MHNLLTIIPGRIYETSEYSVFHKIEYNRKIDQKNVRKIAESIKNHGFFGCIFVDSNMNIIDGQHRLEACKMLGVPVKFCVVESNNSPDLVRDLQVSKKWNDMDMLESLAKCGSKEAAQILTLMSNNPTIPKACAASAIYMILGLTNGNGTLNKLYDSMLKHGGFSDDEMISASVCLHTCSEVLNILHSKYDSIGNTRALAAVVSFAIVHCGVKPETILEKFTKNPYTAPVSLKDTLESVQSLLNYRTINRNRIYLTDAFNQKAREKRSDVAKKYNAAYRLKLKEATVC